MKYFRFITMVAVCVFLAGFKTPARSNHPIGKKQAPIQKYSTPKSLDLKVPLSDISFENAPENLSAVHNGVLDAVANNSLPKTRALELKGRVIVTQEQEAEKSNSADGAGILINLRH